MTNEQRKYEDEFAGKVLKVMARARNYLAHKKMYEELLKAGIQDADSFKNMQNAHMMYLQSIVDMHDSELPMNGVMVEF